MKKTKVDFTTPELIAKNEEKIADLWVEHQVSSDKIRSDLFDKEELKKKEKICSRYLSKQSPVEMSPSGPCGYCLAWEESV